MAIDPSPETLATGYVKIARSLRPAPRFCKGDPGARTIARPDYETR